MKITKVDVIPLALRLEEQFSGGTYRITSRNTIVTRVHTDLGIVGEAFGGDEDRWQPQVVAAMRHHLAPLLIGEDACDVERLWDKMFQSKIDLGNRALHSIDMINRAVLLQGIAALDIAIWDALGKLYGAPLYKLLGGFRDRVPVIAIGGYYQSDDPHHRALQREVLEYQQAGLAGIKLKIGKAEIEQDVDRVRAVRQAVGEDFILACDANQAWTPQEAIAFCRQVEPYNVRWIEEPVQWHDQLGGLRQVREATSLPVVAGQGELTRFGCRDLILHGRVNILNVDATIAGGVTEWRRIAAMACAFNVQMAHHEEAQVASHLLAAIPHGLYAEIFPNRRRDPLWYEIQEMPPPLQEGCLLLSERPGLGLQLNEEVIQRYRLD